MFLLIKFVSQLLHFLANRFSSRLQAGQIQVFCKMYQKAAFSCLFLSGPELRLLYLFIWFSDGIVQAAVRRQSESSEPLTPEPHDVPPQRKRKKKKIPTGM